MFIVRNTLLDEKSFSEAQDYLAIPSSENITYFLAEELIAQLGTENEDVAHSLSLLVDQLFKNGEQNPTLYQELIEKYHDDIPSYRLLVSNYVRIGHFLELSVLARENLFDIYRKRRDDRLKDFDPQRDSVPTLNEDDMIPGGIERVLYPMELSPESDPTLSQRVHVFSSAEEAVDYFNRPTFIPVLTTHPVFVDTLETQKIVRELHDAWREIMLRPKDFAGHAFKRVQKAVHDFRGTELTPISVGADGKKRIAKFKPYDETSFELDTLTQMFKNQDEVYQTIENAFKRRFGKDYTDQLRQELNLQLEPMSWIITDKDGNNNLRAEHVLQSLVRRRIVALELFAEQIRDLEKSGCILRSQLSENWSQLLATALTSLHASNDKLEIARNGSVDIPLSQSEFDQILTDLNDPWGTKGTFADMESHLKRDVDDAFATADQNPVLKEKLLLLKRKLNTFGFKLALSEYRETSEEYTRVIAGLLTVDPFTGQALNYNPDIKDKAELAAHRAKQALLLGRLVREKPDYLSKLAQDFLSEIESTSALRDLSKNDPRAIIYHTLKRMQIAAANPDIFHDTVVAECRGPSNVMEVLALQTIFKPKGSSGIADMHITMLLEDLDKLKTAPQMVMELLENRAYRDHLMRLAGGDISKLKIKIQVAHSDNVRRGGTAAARAYIHEVHFSVAATLKQNQKEIEKLFEADGHDTSSMGLSIEWSEGGSNSDALRNGKRAMTATINAFGLLENFKTTFQGQPDLLGYLGLSTSYKRMMARYYTHCAKELAFREANDNGELAPSATHRLVTKVLEENVLDDYENRHFNALSNQIGHLFAHPLVNYLLYGVIYNRGSRSATRGDEPLSMNSDAEAIDTSQIRTIGFSNVFKDANILPSWLGIELFARHLTGALKSSEGKAALEELSSRMQVPVFNSHGQITDAVLQMIYREQPMFRDVIDKVAYGIVESDIGKLQRRLNTAKEHGIPITPEVNAYVQNLRLEYEHAVLLTLAAFGVDTSEISTADRSTDNDAYLERLRQIVLDTGLKHLKDDVLRKQTFSSFLEVVRDDVIVTAHDRGQKGGQKDLQDEELLLLSDIASGILTARHGRQLAADDPHYGARLRRYNQTAKLAA